MKAKVGAMSATVTLPTQSKLIRTVHFLTSPYIFQNGIDKKSSAAVGFFLNEDQHLLIILCQATLLEIMNCYLPVIIF